MDTANDYNDTTGYNTLFLAVHYGKIILLPFLLTKYSAAETVQGKTLINVAAARGHKNIVSLLTKRDVDLNTPLHIAIKNNQASVFHLLINECNVNAKNCNDDTPLHYAAANNRVEFTKLLIENGASVDVKNSEQKTPLIYALENQNIELAEILFQNGAVLNREFYKSKFLSSAAGNGNLEMVKYLMEKGWNKIDNPLGSGCPLYRAVTSGHLDVVEYLMKHGVIRKVVLRNDTLELARFCMKLGRINILQCLVDGGLKSTQCCFSSATTYHLYGSWLFLLTCRSKISANSYFSRTELHRAVDAGELETVKMIVNQRANTVETDSLACKLAVYIAVENRNEDVLQVLLKAGYSTEACFDDISPVHLAATFEDMRLLKMLLKAGADVNSKTKYNCHTPIDFAAISIQSTVVKFLLENGASEERSSILSFALAMISDSLQRFSVINELAFTKLVKITEMLILYEEKKEIWNLLLHAIRIRIQTDDENEQNSSRLTREASYDYSNDNDDDNDNDKNFLKKCHFRPQLVRCIFNHLTDDEIKHYSQSLLQKMIWTHSSEMLHFLMEYDDSELCSIIEIGNLFVNYKCQLLLIDYSSNVDNLIKFRMNTPSDSNNEEEDKVENTVVLKLIIARLVLLSKPRDSEVTKFCKNHRFQDWRTECRKQKVKMLKTKIVHNCHMTFHDILTEPVDKVANYLRNENFRKVIEASYKKFSAYTDFLKIRVEKGIRRKELREKCMDLMYNVIERNYKIRLSNDGLDHIFQYFSVVDLRRFSDSFS